MDITYPAKICHLYKKKTWFDFGDGDLDPIFKVTGEFSQIYALHQLMDFPLYSTYILL